MGRRKLKLLESRRLLTILLVGAFLWSLASIDWRGPLVHTGGPSAALGFLVAFFPPELSPEFLRLAVLASWQTLTYAVAGITLAVLIGVPMGIIASGATADSPRSALPQVVGVRFCLAALRSIHELVWAVLFVSAFGLSSLTVILITSWLRWSPNAVRGQNHAEHLLIPNFQRRGNIGYQVAVADD